MDKYRMELEAFKIENQQMQCDLIFEDDGLIVYQKGIYITFFHKYQMLSTTPTVLVDKKNCFTVRIDQLSVIRPRPFFPNTMNFNGEIGPTDWTDEIDLLDPHKLIQDFEDLIKIPLALDSELLKDPTYFALFFSHNYSDYHLKLASLMAKNGISQEEAEALLYQQRLAKIQKEK